MHSLFFPTTKSLCFQKQGKQNSWQTQDTRRTVRETVHRAPVNNKPSFSSAVSDSLPDFQESPLCICLEAGGGLLLGFSRQKQPREPKTEFKRYSPPLSNAALERKKKGVVRVPFPLSCKTPRTLRVQSLGNFHHETKALDFRTRTPRSPRRPYGPHQPRSRSAAADPQIPARRCRHRRRALLPAGPPSRLRAGAGSEATSAPAPWAKRPAAKQRCRQRSGASRARCSQPAGGSHRRPPPQPQPGQLLTCHRHRRHRPADGEEQPAPQRSSEGTGGIHGSAVPAVRARP